MRVVAAPPASVGQVVAHARQDGRRWHSRPDEDGAVA